MIVDRTVLVVAVIFIAAALGAVVAIGRRMARRGIGADVQRATSAVGRFVDILTIAVAFGFTTVRSTSSWRS